MNDWLPVVFMGLMGLAMLAYVVLDGYDLGVGVLLRRATPDQRNTMIASIGPFWDANETWLVLGVGLLLVAFPAAHGIILGALYLPVALMLVALMLRGVAFELRAKAAPSARPRWDLAFHGGSLLASLAQGYMLGHYIVGFDPSPAGYGFALLIAPCLTAGYTLLGACWLILKTEGALHDKIRRRINPLICWYRGLNDGADTPTPCGTAGACTSDSGEEADKGVTTVIGSSSLATTSQRRRADCTTNRMHA